MAGSNADYGRKGKIFGKIVIAIILFLLIWIYIYHHADNGITFPQ